MEVGTTLLVAALVVFVAGAVTGLAGFGFAVVGTMALATMFEPATAVVFMIVPILAANLTLVGELSRSELSQCWRRFSPLVVSALIGTIAGMSILGRLPAAPLRTALGLVTIGFVLANQEVVPVWTPSTLGTAPSERHAPMIAVGSVSGLLFGATNVGVQIVAYLRRFALSHGTFVGVVAMVFVGVNSLRVVAAGILGLYPTATVAALSVVAAVPAVLGVRGGKRLRGHLSESRRRQLVLLLLTAVGIRLLVG